jgi:hypothetical protein
MSAENNSEDTKSKTGGFLDSFIRVTTLGKYGVETTTSYPSQRISPTTIPPENSDSGSFSADENTPVMIAIRTGRTVVINDFKELNKPQTRRRIVRR